MYFSRAFPVAVLAACLVAQTAAKPVHEPRSASPDHSRLTARNRADDIGVFFGANPTKPNSKNAWIGTGGPFTTKFVNSATEDIALVVWTGQGSSWVNVNQPVISMALRPGASITVSFQYSAVGGFSAVYSDTKLVNGQISNTWGEFLFSPDFPTYDVSRTINSRGHPLSIVGPTCTADMARCAYVCSDPSATSCYLRYRLLNCATGSQPGALGGQGILGDDSGGCRLPKSTGSLTVTFRQ